MSFKDQSFDRRFSAMGDEAEGKFERIFPDNYVRFGLNRPPLHMASLPERLRHMPDYLTSKGFIECKGIGRDDTVKLKVMEFSCMNFWHQIHPMRIFVWSSYRFAWTMLAFEQIRSLIDDGSATLDRYHDGKAYFGLVGDNFTWTELDRVDN